MQVVTHPDSYLSAEFIGTKVSEYKPTFQIPGTLHSHFTFLKRHDTQPPAGLLSLTAPGLLDYAGGKQIDGWLWPADALKLYEMAYFATGDIVELGTFRGLSTCIMSQAIIDSGRNSKIVTMDICDHGWQSNSDPCGLTDRIDFRLGDATQHAKSFIAEGRKFSFAFVDHSHTYADVANVCPMLPSLLVAESFIQFHDFSDRRNGTDPDYGVWQAVQETLPKSCHFCGIYGCSGLYRTSI